MVFFVDINFLYSIFIWRASFDNRSPLLIGSRTISIPRCRGHCGRARSSGNPRGVHGALSYFSPASCGRRLPLRAFTALAGYTRFSHLSNLMSSVVATLVAIWQKVSCGVRMPIAWQLWLRTNTTVLFNINSVMAVSMCEPAEALGTTGKSYLFYARRISSISN